MSKFKKILSASLLASFFATAQDSTIVTGTVSPGASNELSRVVVTASKYPRKQAATGKVVTVIGSEILDKSSGRTVTELLNQQAGITVIGAQNTLGTNQDVYMRGASLGRTLILLDGVPVYDPSSPTTAFDLNTISIEAVERIEIVKGAQSTLYGSDAVAGVINIITKKGGASGLVPHVVVSGGSFNTYKATAGIGGSSKGTDYNLQYTHHRSSGFSSAADTLRNGNFDNDGFRQNVVNGSIGTSVTEHFKIRGYGQYSRYFTELDAAAFKDERDYTANVQNHSAGASADWNYGRGNLFFNYNYNFIERRYLDDSLHIGGFSKFSESRFAGHSHFAEAYTRFGVIPGLLEVLAGADFRMNSTDQRYFSLSSFGPYETALGADSARSNQYSLFASGVLQPDRDLYLELGGRLNNHSEYGTNFTYTFNPAYIIGERVKIFANAASAFKVPSPYQLFDPSIGNKDLDPERSRTLEGGVQVFFGKQAWLRTVYFNRNIKNGIDYNFATNKYFNYNTQEDHGAEVDAEVRQGIFSFRGNYTYVTGNVSAVNYVYNAATWGYEAKGDTTYNNLFRRPKHSVNGTFGFTLSPSFFISLTGKWVGNRMEPVFGGAPVEMPGYKTVDVYSEYSFSKGWKLFADLKNITDERYYDVRGYNTRRFHYVTGIRYTFAR
jgi:vitamin B12 transporter